MSFLYYRVRNTLQPGVIHVQELLLAILPALDIITFLFLGNINVIKQKMDHARKGQCMRKQSLKGLLTDWFPHRPEPWAKNAGSNAALGLMQN